MSENVIDYSLFKVKRLLKNKAEHSKISTEDRQLLSEWLKKNTDLNSPIYTEIIDKRDRKEELTDTENLILRSWAIKKSIHAANLIKW